MRLQTFAMQVAREFERLADRKAGSRPFRGGLRVAQEPLANFHGF
jgi:hypothetical protein